MRIISSLIGFALLFFLAWPYINVYRLSGAAAAPQSTALESMLDMEAIRKTYQAQLEKNIQTTVNSTGVQAGGLLGNVLQNIGSLGGMAVEQYVDVNWVRQQLQGTATDPTLWGAMDYAFFESPTRFVVRKGKLGENPTFVELTLQDWSWRVTAIY
jgi:hypothetical protein